MTVIAGFSFEVQPREGETPPGCWAACRDALAGWVREFFDQAGQRVAVHFDGTRLVPVSGHEVRGVQHEGATHRLATMDWQYLNPGDPSVLWQFGAALACDGQRIEAALTGQAVARSFALRPFRQALEGGNPLSLFPVLLRRLLHGWACRMEGQPVPTRARMLAAGQVKRFVRDTLLSPARVLPVVVLALGQSPETNADAMQKGQGCLLGLAQIVGLLGDPAGHRLAECLGPERSCAGGVLRIYWPGFTRDDPPRPTPCTPRRPSSRRWTRARSGARWRWTWPPSPGAVAGKARSPRPPASPWRPR
jgi:hypothetical protein